MANFSGNEPIDFMERQIATLVEGMRPKPEVRAELDIGYTYAQFTLELFEIRPNWVKPDAIDQHSFAKCRFVKSRGVWKLYWMRASGRWEAYAPCPEANDIYTVFDIINEDEMGCFFG